jgi:hypothetical protein
LNLDEYNSFFQRGCRFARCASRGLADVDLRVDSKPVEANMTPVFDALKQKA